MVTKTLCGFCSPIDGDEFTHLCKNIQNAGGEYGSNLAQVETKKCLRALSQAALQNLEYIVRMVANYYRKSFMEEATCLCICISSFKLNRKSHR